MDEAPVLINEEALTEAFVPTRLFKREGQARELERARLHYGSDLVGFEPVWVHIPATAP
jgi:hypothetical protein